MTRKKKQKAQRYSVRDTLSVHTAGNMLFKKSFFSVLKCFHSERKNNFGLDIACLWKQPLLTLAFVVRRAGPCTLKGYTVFSFVHSALFLFFFCFLSSILLFMSETSSERQSFTSCCFCLCLFLCILHVMAEPAAAAAAAQKAAAGRP